MKTYILFLLILIIAGLVYYFGFSKKENPLAGITRQDELIKEILKPGEGSAAKSGDTVVVHYTGTLLDGKKFDSSLDRGTSFSFTIGAGRVIQGWEQGIVGMQVGEKRKLIIPPSLAYGNNAVGPIPANSTLIFEVELLEIK